MVIDIHPGKQKTGPEFVVDAMKIFYKQTLQTLLSVRLTVYSLSAFNISVHLFFLYLWFIFNFSILLNNQQSGGRQKSVGIYHKRVGES